MFDLSVLYNNSITFDKISVVRNVVYPPDPYVIRSGQRCFSRFFYVIRGEIVFNKGSASEVAGRAGDIIYLPYNVEYASSWSEESLGEYITVKFVLNDPPVSFSEGICIAIHDKDKSYFRIFNEMYLRWTKGAYDSKLYATRELFSLMCALSSDTSGKIIKARYKTIYKGVLYLEQHFLEDFTVDDLAEMCSVSCGTFRRLFKEYKQMTPIEYRNFLRIKRARELIKSGDWTVSQAAEEVKCYDLSYFNRLFKRYYNVNPSKYKL